MTGTGRNLPDRNLRPTWCRFKGLMVGWPRLAEIWQLSLTEWWEKKLNDGRNQEVDRRRGNLPRLLSHPESVPSSLCHLSISGALPSSWRFNLHQHLKHWHRSLSSQFSTFWCLSSKIYHHKGSNSYSWKYITVHPTEKSQSEDTPVSSPQRINFVCPTILNYSPYSHYTHHTILYYTHHARQGLQTWMKCSPPSRLKISGPHTRSTPGQSRSRTCCWPPQGPGCRSSSYAFRQWWGWGPYREPRRQHQRQQGWQGGRIRQGCPQGSHHGHFHLLLHTSWCWNLCLPIALLRPLPGRQAKVLSSLNRLTDWISHQPFISQDPIHCLKVPVQPVTDLSRGLTETETETDYIVSPAFQLQITPRFTTRAALFAENSITICPGGKLEQTSSNL